MSSFLINLRHAIAASPGWAAFFALSAMALIFFVASYVQESGKPSRHRDHDAQRSYKFWGGVALAATLATAFMLYRGLAIGQVAG